MKLQNLDDWQQDILKTKGHLLLCTGRQVGKTTILSIKAAEYMIKHKSCQIIVCSLTEDQAQLIIVMMLNYLEENYKTYLAKKKKAPTKNTITLNNKSKVISRPVGNTGNAVRGFTGDVLILDEASRMPEFIFTASKPTLLTRGGEIWICSTPFGKSGYFYECFENKNKRFSVFHINSEQVINERTISNHWTERQRAEAIRFLEEEKQDMSKLEYEQEYLGHFVDDLRQLFPDELIDKCCKATNTPIVEYGKYYMGIDVARMGGDETTYQILQLINNKVLLHIESIAKVRQFTTDSIKDILNLQAQYKFQKIYIDTGGIGAAVFDQLMMESSTRNRTEAIDNATRAIDNEDGRRKLRKEELYMNMLRLMERGEITLLDDEKVRLSLKSVQYEYIIKENQMSKIRIFGKYTHIAEGLIRAAWCANTKGLNLWCRYN